MPEAQIIVKDEMKRYLPYLGTFRYVRPTFWQAGQDSYSQPPAQNPDLFELLTNVQPVMQGTLQKRWGHSLFNSLTHTVPLSFYRAFSYQRDADGIRKIIAYDDYIPTYPYSIIYGEDGSWYTAMPGSTVAYKLTPPRAISSRDYLYQTPFGVKWDGTQLDDTFNTTTVTNSGSGSITGTYIYYVLLQNANAQLCPIITTGGGIGKSFSLTSSSNSVQITSPPTQTTLALLSTPTISALTQQASGGTLTHATTFAYRVAATNAVGITLASSEVTTTTGSGADTYQIVISWNLVTNATGYKVYGRTSGSELLLGTVTSGSILTWTDTGALTPLGALPTVNNTAGYLVYAGSSSGPFYYQASSPIGTNVTLSSLATSGTQLPCMIISANNSIIPAGAGFGQTNHGIIAPTVAPNVSASAANWTGIVSTSTTTVTWVSGSKFQPSGIWPSGTPITINGVGYTISSVTNSTTLVLNSSAGTQTNVNYSVSTTCLVAIGYASTQDLSSGQHVVNWYSGSQFVTDGSWNGLMINVNGTGYTISTVVNVVQLLITTSAGNQAPVPYNISFGTGTVNTSGQNVTLVSGGNFPTGSQWSGVPITINGVLYTIQSINSSTNLTLTSSAGTQSGVTYTIGGSVTLSVGRIYFYVYRNSTTGNRSDLSPASTSTGPLINGNVNVTVTPSPDWQVDTIEILATVDGGDNTLLYLVGITPNLVYGVPLTSGASLVDNLTEPILEGNQVYGLYDVNGNPYGVYGNQPPPAGITCLTKYQGRLWGILGQNVYFSKNISEVTTSTGFVVGRYEECWPSQNYFDISEAAETLHAVLTDGATLYLATERRVRKLFGTTAYIGVVGTPFQLPAVVFNELGTVNQEVWQIVFAAGQPVGAMWLTPDKRVILSDFNSYQDVGHPIQDVLNTINVQNIQTSCSMFASSGPYDLYFLAFPTGSNSSGYPDTVAIYNMRTGSWFIWIPTDQIAALLFNIVGGTSMSAGTPQFLACSGTASSTLLQFSSANTSDSDASGGPYTGIPVTIQTSWLAFGDPALRKVLNEMEVLTGDTTNLQITVWGACTEADFASPTAIVTSVSLFQNILGVWKLALAAYKTGFCYLKFLFYLPASSTATQVLEGINVEATPIHRD